MTSILVKIIQSIALDSIPIMVPCKNIKVKDASIKKAIEAPSANLGRSDSHKDDPFLTNSTF
ncbi:MAG: hypothetical protein AAGC64_01365 [Bacteroidota bacterium]